ncbi:MAG: phosphoribosylglycinamide formyltransferase [Pseudomonadota bacterium]
MERLRLAILISGTGTNMLAIARACAAGQIAADVAVVISDQPAAAGLQRARALGLATQVVDSAADRTVFESALAAAIDASQATLVVLAGFMRVLSAGFVSRYAGRLLNIHPSLLPHHKGLDTHARALAAGDAEHGASVHFVTAQLDGGPVVLQRRVPVLPGDDAETLSARVHAIEHIIYPQVIGWMADRRLEWNDGSPTLDGTAL